MVFPGGRRVSLLLLTGATAVNLFAAVAPVSIVHGNVRVEIKTAGGVLQENFSVRNKSGWTTLATSNGKSQGALSIRSVGSAILTGSIESVSRKGDSVVEEIAGDGWNIKKTIEGFGDRGWIHISTVLTTTRPFMLHSYTDMYQAELQPEWSFSPSVGGFNPDGQYKSPLIMAQG